MDPAQADEVDPKLYSYRINVSMETGDGRYLHLNTGMWVGSGIRRGGEGEFLSLVLGCGGRGFDGGGWEEGRRLIVGCGRSDL